MLKGKVAVVTGAAMGIGQATTELLLQKGAKVALLDVNETAGNSAKEALDEEHGAESTLFLQCNVESDKDVKDAFRATVETFGGIDIVCNNAGILNEDNWEKALSTNLAGVIRVGFVALEHMNKLTGGRGGVIVNTASLAAPVFPVYSATKHGVVGFTRSMAVNAKWGGKSCCGSLSFLFLQILIEMKTRAHFILIYYSSLLSTWQCFTI
uniref:15-hydroxyprostaglandin dehydrogenase [NAD(+)]-like n=1 Tax=Salarias fasciatus TaxID=181472 RepID=A0A672GJI8_SALFA